MKLIKYFFFFISILNIACTNFIQDFTATHCTLPILLQDLKIKNSLLKVDINSIPPILKTIEDDLTNLEFSILKSIEFYEKNYEKIFFFGKDNYTAEELKKSLLFFLKILKSQKSSKIKNNLIKKYFIAYKATGNISNGSVLFTGYFEPILRGSLIKTEKFKWPIYAIPNDLITINLGRFKKKYQGEKIIGRINNTEFVPYYNRKEIDQDNILYGKNLEIAWIDNPIEIFNLHTQGSGVICLKNKKCLQISYANENGQPYQSIGKYLQENNKIKKHEISYININQYLANHFNNLSDILSKNKSYVFFRIVPIGPIGSISLPLTEERSIATDPNYFPKGALALIKTKKTIINNIDNVQNWENFVQLVLNQDTGGAIKGPGRVDIFFGLGKQAELQAGSMKEIGELYFLIKKNIKNK